MNHAAPPTPEKKARSADSSNAASYLLTLPERVLRSASAVSAGLVRELGDTVLPKPVRETRLYENMVASTLRFLIEQVGQVEGTFPEGGELSSDFALRRAAGNGIDALGIVAFRASPVWVLAALADATGTGRVLIREIADSLKKEKLLDPEMDFSTVDQILDGLEATSTQLAGTANTPPLDTQSLRKEWQELQNAVSRIPPRNLPSPKQLAEQWKDLTSTAQREGKSVFQVSSLMALSAVQHLPSTLLWLSQSATAATRRTASVFASPLLEHYSTTLAEIRATGFMEYWTREFQPYLAAAAAQFSQDHSTLTGRLLGLEEDSR